MLQLLHPFSVHFAIALIVTATIFDVLSLWRQNERLLFAGYWNTLAGAIGVLVAVGTGLLAESSQPLWDDGAASLLVFHKVFGLAAGGIWVLLALTRIAMRGYIRQRLQTPYMAASLLVVALIVVTGTLGGTLVYGYGVGISSTGARKAMRIHNELETPKPIPKLQPVLKEAPKK